MKIFNVSLRVSINQIGEIPDNPPTETPLSKQPFNDDPVDKQEKMISKYLDRMAEMQTPRAPGFASESEGAAMNRSVRVQAETFEDLSAILQKFSNVLKEIPAVDGTLLKVAIPVVPSGPFVYGSGG